MAEKEKSTTVKSVFKSGKSTTTQREFTDKWIELINALEKGKKLVKNVTTAPGFIHRTWKPLALPQKGTEN